MLFIMPFLNSHRLPVFVCLQLSWTVDRDVDRVEADRALGELSDKVKLGEIRATYIQQDSESGDSTLVTLNAGIKRDPI